MIADSTRGFPRLQKFLIAVFNLANQKLIRNRSRDGHCPFVLKNMKPNLVITPLRYYFCKRKKLVI